MKFRKAAGMICAAVMMLGAALPADTMPYSITDTLIANAEIEPDTDTPAPDVLEYFTEGSFYCGTVKENGVENVWIFGYKDNDKSVTIPSTIRNKKVTRLTSSAFDTAPDGEYAMTELTIPSTVNCIEGGAFGQKCKNLTTIHVDNNPYFEFTGGILYAKDVTKVCGKKYEGCEVTKSVLKCCSKNTSITIPSGVTTIEWFAFDGCESLQRIVLPTTVTAIGGYAFNGCTSLSQIEVPYGTKYIGKGAFAACHSLVSVKLPSTLTKIDNYAFMLCSSLKTIRIPQSVKTIGFSVFESCNAEVIYESGGSSTDEPAVPTVKPITSAVITLRQTSFTYDGTAKKPTVVVKNGNDILSSARDYNVSYKNNIKAGTATVTVTGKNLYSGSKSKTFTIKKANIASAKVTGIKNKAYTGKAITQSFTVKLGSKTLVKGTDYTVTYKNNKKLGKATITIKGKGNCTGTLKKTFKITKAAVTKAKITGIAARYKATGKAIKPAVKKVTLGGVTLKKGRDYTVSYKNNKKAGTATVIIKGKGNYKGTAKKTFKILSAQDYKLWQYSKQVVDLVNKERTSRGLKKLTLDETLYSKAMIRAKETVKKFSHTRPDGTDCFTVLNGIDCRCAGENIAAGQRTPKTVSNDWMNSPGHRSNILNKDFTKIGVGVVYDPHNIYGYFWVQLFTG